MLLAASFVEPLNLSHRAIAAVMATERPRVKVAINALAATVEIPNATESLLVATAKNSFALATVTNINALSLFKALATCCKPIVMDIRA